jgi:MFS transporter, ACDE family, multidrug resistance protein
MNEPGRPLLRILGLLPRLLDLDGFAPATQRGLAVAFSTSIAVVMGMQLVYPALPAMMVHLQVDAATIGLVVTAYTLPAVFLTPLAGAIADLKGRRWLLVGGMLLFGLAGVAVGFASSFGVVLALRALQGIGATALSPLTIVLLSDLVREEREASVQGAKVVLDRVAMTVAPVLAGLLAALAWNLPFFLYALAIPAAALAWAWLPETRPPGPGSGRAYLGGFATIAQRPRVLLAFAAGSLRFFLDYGYFTYLPVYLAFGRQSASSLIGVAFAAFAIGAMLTASQVGRFVRGRDPAPVLFGGFALAGGSVLAIPVLPATGLGDALVVASLFVYGLGNGLISPLQKGLLTRNAPGGVLAGVVALDRMLQQVAKSIAPAAMGLLLAATSLQVGFWVLGGLSLASVAIAAVVLTNGHARAGRACPRCAVTAGGRAAMRRVTSQLLPAGLAPVVRRQYLRGSQRLGPCVGLRRPA